LLSHQRDRDLCRDASEGRSRYEEFLRSLEYYHLTWPVACLAGLLKRDHGRKGTITVADATIAAVALVYELTLMTDNAKDFPMKDLTLY
jgi:predicted nucleic acid-binding protein